MKLAAADLLDDVETLRVLLLAARAEVAAAEAEAGQIALEPERLGIAEADRARLEAEVARLEEQNERYEHIIAQLRRLQFGKRSEQLDKDQQRLAFEDLVQGLAEIEQEVEKADPALNAHRARERREKRPSLPDHLPRVDVVIEPETTACPCCAGTMHVIGEDVPKRLDVVSAQYAGASMFVTRTAPSWTDHELIECRLLGDLLATGSQAPRRSLPRFRRRQSASITPVAWG